MAEETTEKSVEKTVTTPEFMRGRGKGESKAEYVTKTDFEDAIGRITASVEKLAGAVADRKEDPKPAAAPVGGPDEFNPIPPQWRAAVDEILGADVGIKVEYPDGGGFKFTLMIPKERSNASKEYWQMYQCDHRTKMLNPSDGISGVRKYCELVKQNLNTKK